MNLFSTSPFDYMKMMQMKVVKVYLSAIVEIEFSPTG